MNQKQKIILVANWKMNPSNSDEAERNFKFIKTELKDLKNLEIIICPPFVWLSFLKNQPTPQKKSEKIQLGGQDMFWQEKGSFTGEISAQMLKNCGANFVILGHSERKEYLNETNEMINKKLLTALRFRLKPIVCVGEKERKTEEDISFEEIKAQILEIFEGVKKYFLPDIIIAYEPVWAIGSGQTPSENDIMKIVILIRQLFSKIYDQKTAQKIKILYGGSVNSRNAGRFIFEAGTDGLLIGKVSLNAGEFVRIAENINSQNNSF